MQRSRWAILWAIVLILGGGLLLAQNLGLVGQQFQASVWTVVFGALGVLFLLDAITTAGRDWWALIPGCILLGVAVTIWLSELPDRPIRGEFIGSLMTFSAGLPFLLIYAVKRGGFWWALIPGYIITVAAVTPLLTLSVPGEVIGTFVLWAIGIPFIVVYLANRQNWWALIPGGILIVVGVIPILTLTVRGEVIGSFVLWAIGLAFIAIYLINRRQSWALIPGGILIGIGVIPILTLGVRGEVIGTYVMWVIALPFIVVYLINRRHWWAIIPGGTLFVIGLVPLLVATGVPGQFASGILFLGMAAVFGLIYLLNLGNPDMFWPVYPAVVLFAIGIIVMAIGQDWWPLVLIALGAALLIRALLPRRQ